MYRYASFVLGLCLLAGIGCERRSEIEGPTVNKFTGQLVADGKPVAFKDGDKVVLNLMHHKAQSFGIPIKPDGSFDIGEMPIGKYSGQLVIERQDAESKKRGRNPGLMHSLPEGFEIKEGQTQYQVDLGKKYRTQ